MHFGKLRTAVVLLLASSLTVLGVFVDTPVASTAPGDAHLVVSLGSINPGRSGEFYDYEVQVGNNGSEADSVQVSFDLAPGSHEVTVLNPEAACQEYEYKTGSGDQPIGGAVNCFVSDPKITSGYPGAYSEAKVTVNIKRIANLRSFRFKVRAKLPYRFPSAQLNLRADTSGTQNNAGSENLISVSQTVDSTPAYAGRVDATIEKLSTESSLTLGNPANWDINGNIVKYRATWQNNGELTAFGLDLNTTYTIQPLNLSEFRNPPASKYRTSAVCNEALSSPGVCSRINGMPTSHDESNRENARYSEPAKYIKYLAKGEKVVFDITGQVHFACTPQTLGKFGVFADAYPGRTVDELNLDNSTVVRNFLLMDVEDKECAQTNLQITTSLPENGNQGANNTVKYRTRYENVGSLNIENYLVDAKLETRNRNYGDALTADITFRCTGSQPGLCPSHEYKQHYSQIISAENFVSRMGFPPVNIPAGEFIELDVSVAYTTPKCFDQKDLPAGTSIPVEIVYTSRHSSKIVEANGVRVIPTSTSELSKQHTYTGLTACAESKRELDIAITYPYDQRVIGWTQPRTYTVTVTNKGNRAYDATPPRTAINLGISEQDKQADAHKYMSHRIEYLLDSNAMQKLIRTDGHQGNPYDTSLAGTSFTVFPRDHKLMLAPQESITFKVRTTLEDDIKGFCPASKAVNGAYLQTLTNNNTHWAGFELKTTLKRFYANPADAPSKNEQILVLCNNITSSITSPSPELGADEAMTITATIENLLGYAGTVPYELRFPAGSINFPADALGQDLFAAGAARPDILQCTATSPATCKNITGVLSKEIIDGKTFLVIKGNTGQMKNGNGRIQLQITGKSGVIGNSQEGYKASLITQPIGDVQLPGNDPTLGLPANTYNLSQATWKLANQQVQYGVSHNVTVEGNAGAQLPQLDFGAELECTSSYTQTPAAVSVAAGQTSGQEANAGQQWLKDTCTLTATAPEAPAGYAWKNTAAPAGTNQLSTSYAQTSTYHVATDTPHTYQFNWALVRDPRVDVPQPVAVDLCGPDNAHWELPADTNHISWHLSTDGTLTATALNGALLGPDFAQTKSFPKPADSGLACPTLQVKVHGERVANTDHQFTAHWQQPATHTGATEVEVTTNIPTTESSFTATSGTIDLNGGQAGTLTLRTQPAGTQKYDAKTLTGTDKAPDAPSANLTVPTNPQTTDTEASWELTLPATAKQVECAVEIEPALSTLTVTAKDGGYPGQPLGTATTLDGTGWTLYPEVNGQPDTSRPVVLTATPGQAEQFTAADLVAGTYYLARTTTPTGYQTDQLTGTATPTADAVTPAEVGGQKYLKINLQAGQPLTVETNTLRQFGSLALEKTSAVNGNLLGGSHWELTETTPGAAGTVRNVVDCVADNATSCPASGYDTNPAAGNIQVADLPWGDYRLIETKAPAGYRLPNAATGAKTFTISGTNLAPAYTGNEAITNDYASVPDIPHTGGLGREHLLIAGFAVLLLAGAATVVLQRKAQQLLENPPIA